MKIGKKGIEGTPEEIRYFCADTGFKFEDLFDLPKKINIIWLIIPVGLFILNSSFLCIVDKPSIALYGILIILELSIICWLIVSIHLIFKNYFVSVLCTLFLLVIFSFCLGTININEAIKTIQNKISIRIP